MDGRAQGTVGEWASGAATLFARDTIVAALRVMQELGVREMDVVDEELGEHLGMVTEEELRRLWKVAPLASMEEILSGLFDATPENEPVEVPLVQDVAPLVNYHGIKGSWVH